MSHKQPLNYNSNDILSTICFTIFIHIHKKKKKPVLSTSPVILSLSPLQSLAIFFLPHFCLSPKQLLATPPPPLNYPLVSVLLVISLTLKSLTYHKHTGRKYSRTLHHCKSPVNKDRGPLCRLAATESLSSASSIKSMETRGRWEGWNRLKRVQVEEQSGAQMR